MRIFACLFLTIFCFSLSIQAQGDKPNKKIQNLERELLEFNLDIQYLNSEDGKVLYQSRSGLRKMNQTEITGQKAF